MGEETAESLMAADTLMMMQDPHRRPEVPLEMVGGGGLQICSHYPLQKIVSRGDVNPRVSHRNALLLPMRDVTRHVLPFLNASEIPRSGIPVRVYDAYGRVYSLSFLHGNDGKFALASGVDNRWSDVCDGLGLREGDMLKLWTLRHQETNQLSFLIESERGEETQW